MKTLFLVFIFLFGINVFGQDIRYLSPTERFDTAMAYLMEAEKSAYLGYSLVKKTKLKDIEFVLDSVGDANVLLKDKLVYQGNLVLRMGDTIKSLKDSIGALNSKKNKNNNIHIVEKVIRQEVKVLSVLGNNPLTIDMNVDTLLEAISRVEKIYGQPEFFAQVKNDLGDWEGSWETINFPDSMSFNSSVMFFEDYQMLTNFTFVNKDKAYPAYLYKKPLSLGSGLWLNIVIPYICGNLTVFISLNGQEVNCKTDTVTVTVRDTLKMPGKVDTVKISVPGKTVVTVVHDTVPVAENSASGAWMWDASASYSSHFSKDFKFFGGRDVYVFGDLLYQVSEKWWIGPCGGFFLEKRKNPGYTSSWGRVEEIGWWAWSAAAGVLLDRQNLDYEDSTLSRVQFSGKYHFERSRTYIYDTLLNGIRNKLYGYSCGIDFMISPNWSSPRWNLVSWVGFTWLYHGISKNMDTTGGAWQQGSGELADAFRWSLGGQALYKFHDWFHLGPEMKYCRASGGKGPSTLSTGLMIKTWEGVVGGFAEHNYSWNSASVPASGYGWTFGLVLDISSMVSKF